MALIRSLHCERLASNEENLRLIDSFYSTRNNNVAEALLNEAYQEDESGVIAYYGDERRTDIDTYIPNPFGLRRYQ